MCNRGNGNGRGGFILSPAVWILSTQAVCPSASFSASTVLEVRREWKLWDNIWVRERSFFAPLPWDQPLGRTVSSSASACVLGTVCSPSSCLLNHFPLQLLQAPSAKKREVKQQKRPPLEKSQRTNKLLPTSLLGLLAVFLTSRQQDCLVQAWPCWEKKGRHSKNTWVCG